MDMDPETLAKLKKMGLFSDAAEKNLKQEKKEKEQQQKAKQKRDLQNLETHNNSFGRNNKGGQRTGSGRAPVHQTYSSKKPYGQAINLPADVLPADIATAPYNFVPLPKAVLPSPVDELLAKESPREAWQEYLTQGKHVSGHIALKIETLTPLFIGSGKENGEKTFAPAGKEMIPGSELRGMIKNLYKMITCGVWHADEDTTDRHLYYRCLMASKAQPYNHYLNACYKDKMVDGATNKKKVLPGFMVKRRSKWYLYPLLPEKLKSIPIYQYVQDFHLNVNRDLKKSKIVWSKEANRTGKTAYIQVGMLSTKKLKMSENELKHASPNERKTWGKQYYRKLCVDDIDKSEAMGMEVPPKVIEDYQNDENRRGVDILRQAVDNDGKPQQVAGLPAFDGIAPCFYLLDESGQVKSFGHGQSYRIPYDNSVMDAVNDAVKEDLVDFTDAVFGCSGRSSEDASWGSRVMFEDAPAVSGVRIGKATEAHMLMQPNPTSFQLYLKQNDSNKLVFWDSPGEPEIRGYKMYWHSSPNHDWHANSSEKDTNDNRTKGTEPLLKKMAPIEPGAIFSGNIRFQNLTAEELGALLKIFSLAKNGEDIAFKIGMGKSIGLGSIRMTPTLYVEDGSRYQTLFDADGWHVSEKKTNPEHYIQAYESYLQQARHGKVVSSYEETLTSLRTMLNFANTKLKGWEKATAQMNGDTDPNHAKSRQEDTRFQNRNVLPSITEVLQKVKGQQRK